MGAMIVWRFAPGTNSPNPPRHEKLTGRDDLIAPELAELARLDDQAFRTKFAGSPIKRIGRNRFVRNVLIAIGNSGDQTLVPVAESLRQDPDTVLAEAADWAMRRLAASCQPSS